MRLLVTRPLDDAQPLAEKLEGLGHEAVIVPLMQIVARDNVTIPDAPYQALCVSSANGLTAKADLSPYHHLPFFAVGPQSAKEARRQGFDHVHDRGGNVEGLARAICKALKPADGAILYLSGSETSGDLEGKLKAQGFTVNRVIVYDAAPCDVAELPSVLQGVDGVLLYSPRTTKLWISQLSAASCMEKARSLVHFCLSANVAANLPQGFAKRIAQTPDENGMLTLLDQVNEAD